MPRESKYCKAIKIQQGVGKDTVITFFKNVEGYWESSR